jgi:hypothetical protein
MLDLISLCRVISHLLPIFSIDIELACFDNHHVIPEYIESVFFIEVYIYNSREENSDVSVYIVLISIDSQMTR